MNNQTIAHDIELDALRHAISYYPDLVTPIEQARFEELSKELGQEVWIESGLR